MSEWLSTGEIIEYLKDGEIAEIEGGTIQIINDNGHFKYANNDYRDYFRITPMTKNGKWRILPNYISFKEAMKAIDEGNTVVLHRNGRQYQVARHCGFIQLSNRGLMWQHLVEGNWSIE